MNLKNKISFSLIGIFLLYSFGQVIDFFDYENQEIPNYIDSDNTPEDNFIVNKTATLGRVLFYDKKLSLNNTIACANCHLQEFAFSDTSKFSVGFDGGLTEKHSMRLPYSRFSFNERFFWDGRAASLEEQTTMPIKDFHEMGFSGDDGQPSFDSLITKLSEIEFYTDIFSDIYGDSFISEERISKAIAQFVRSIFSFDSKFDKGLELQSNIFFPFPNFTSQENDGKSLFFSPPTVNGAACSQCHVPPHFNISALSGNNGVLSSPEDTLNIKSPSLRDLFNPEGNLNGPLMHNGEFNTLIEVLEHYNLVPQDSFNTNLDNHLMGEGGKLALSADNMLALEAFLKTLTSEAIYVDKRWSNPFTETGELDLSLNINEHSLSKQIDFIVYPNPTNSFVNIEVNTLNQQSVDVQLFDVMGRKIQEQISIVNNTSFNVNNLADGIYFISIVQNGVSVATSKVIVQQ